MPRRAISSRALLASLPVAAEALEHLSESGREGSFVFKIGDFRTQVAGDPTQLTYVAPARAPDGSAGVWVRQSSATGTLIAGTTGTPISPVTGKYVHIQMGDQSNVDTGLQPGIKVQRVLLTTDAQLLAAGATGTDASDMMASIDGSSTGAAACQAQVVGVRGYAFNSGNTNSATLAETRPDACGIYGYGTIYGAGIGVGIGGFFMGQRATTTAQYTGIEVQARNDTGTGTSYSPTNFCSSAQWVNANGTADTGAGILIGNPFGRQFDYGIAANGQVTGGKTGGIKTAFLRDDSTGITSLLVNGSHTNAIDTRGATLSGKAVVVANAHQIGWDDLGLSRSAAGLLKVTNGSTGDGGLQLVLTNAANDAAAATAGVAVGQLYRNGGAVMIRLA